MTHNYLTHFTKTSFKIPKILPQNYWSELSVPIAVPVEFAQVYKLTRFSNMISKLGIN